MSLEKLDDQVRLPYREEAILSGDPSSLNDYLRDLIRNLEDNRLQAIHERVNSLIDFTPGTILYFGSKDSTGDYPDGTWRIRATSAGSLFTELKVSGAWITKETIDNNGLETIADIIVSGMTASRLVSSSSTKQLTSVSDLTSWITGDTDEITVTNDGDGTVTIGISNPLIVGKGGTGAATFTDGGVLLGSGTGAITAMAVLSDGQFIVGNGTNDPVAESGATLRTSIGVGTGDSPTFTGLTITNSAVLGSNSVVFQPGTDSITFLQVLDADGGTPILNIDSTNERVGIGTATPGTDFEVAGQVKITGGSPGSGKVLTSDGVGLASWAVAAAGGDFSDGGDTAGANRTLGNNDSYTLALETNNTVALTIDTAQDVELAKTLTLVKTTSSTTGVIYKGANRFIHNFAGLDGGAVPQGNNTFVGEYSGNFTMAAVSSVAEASANVGCGFHSLHNLTYGNWNTGIGYWALSGMTTGRGNVGLGYVAGVSITTGGNNLMIGTGAGSTVSTTSSNVCIGQDCYQVGTGNGNVAIGALSLYRATGSYGVGIGYLAGLLCTSAYNTFLGALCGQGSGNYVGVGLTMVGYQAGNVLAAGCDNSTMVGHQAGKLNTSGGDNVFLGYKAGYNNTTVSNLLILDNQNRSSAADEITDSLVYGVFNSTVASQTFRVNGRIGANATPLAMCHIDQPVTDEAIPVLYLDQADISEEMIEFNTTIGTGNAIEIKASKTLTTTHFIKVTLPGPLTCYIPCGTIAS